MHFKNIFISILKTCFFKKLDFDHQIKNNQKAINSKIEITIKKYYISQGIWINHYRNNGNQSKILIKLFLIKYNTDLKNQNMNYIKKI